MSLPIVPLSKLGTPFQSPSWRYQAVYCPERFGFGQYCSKPMPNAGNLARLITNGLTPVEKFTLPIYLRQLKAGLPGPLYAQLTKVWQKHYYASRHKKITFNVNARSGLMNWHMKKLDKINDTFLVKLIRHCYNMEGDEHIGEAIKFYKNESNAMARKWINYSIYGGKSDKELAVQWRKPVRFIQALRLIFFDYSGWPKDKLVQYSLIRQLANNEEIDDPDYHAFRRIFDLGEVGLRSILGHQVLTDKERETVKSYLAGAGVDNLLDQRFTITDLRSSVIFNQSVAGYANLNVRKLELEQKAAIMRLTATKMEREMGIEDNVEVFSEDTQLIDNMREMMEKERKVAFPSYIDVQSVQISPRN